MNQISNKTEGMLFSPDTQRFHKHLSICVYLRSSADADCVGLFLEGGRYENKMASS